MKNVNHNSALLIFALTSWLLSACVLIDVQNDQPVSQVINKEPTSAQANARGNEQSGNSIFKQEGWELPDPSKCKVISPRRLFKSDESYPVKVFYTKYEPRQELLLETPLGTFGENHPAASAAKKLMVKSFFVYDVNHHIFCYRVLADVVFIDKESNSKYSLGTLSFYTYYDNNGDGNFEEFQITEFFSFKPQPPQWLLPNNQ